MIVIGSRAIDYQLKRNNIDLINFNEERISKSDWDVIMSYSDFNKFISINNVYITVMYPSYDNKYHIELSKNNKKYFYEIELGFDNFSSNYLLNNYKDFTEGFIVDDFENKFNVLNLKTSYLTKKAHKFYPPHFEKTISDYHSLKSLFDNDSLNSIEREYFNIREKEALKRMKGKYRVRSLNMSNEDFFKNPLVEPLQCYEHDDLHEVVKHYEKPIYELMKYNFSKAWCEEELFNTLSDNLKIKSVQEEAYVIALERFIIPNNLNKEEELYNAYKTALIKICTTLCSGWFRDYACDNYYTILNNYNIDFYYKFKMAVNKKEIITKEEKRIAI